MTVEFISVLVLQVVQVWRISDTVTWLQLLARRPSHLPLRKVQIENIWTQVSICVDLEGGCAERLKIGQVNNNTQLLWSRSGCYQTTLSMHWTLKSYQPQSDRDKGLQPFFVLLLLAHNVASTFCMILMTYIKWLFSCVVNCSCLEVVYKSCFVCVVQMQSKLRPLVALGGVIYAGVIFLPAAVK